MFHVLPYLISSPFRQSLIAAPETNGRQTTPCTRRLWISLRKWDVSLSTPPVLHLVVLLLHSRTLRSRAASRDSSGGENIIRPGCFVCESSRFCCYPWICELQAPEQWCVHMRSGLACATLSMLQLRVQECSAQTPPALTCATPTASLFQHVDHEIVRRQDTARASKWCSHPRWWRVSAREPKVTFIGLCHAAVTVKTNVFVNTTLHCDLSREAI